MLNKSAHCLKSSTQDLISNLHVLFEVKRVGDSRFMNDRIALISHSFALVCIHLSFVFTRLYSSIICLWFVFIHLHWSLFFLYSYGLVSHLSALVLPPVSNISNNREGPRFLKNIVEYNNRSRKQTKIEIDDFLLNCCDERIVKRKAWYPLDI